MIRLLLLAVVAVVVKSDEEQMKNLTVITWAHAVNNKTYLTEALKMPSCMLEADVVLGQLVGKEGPPIPIMAHPPAVTSDLSLAEFLETVQQHNQKFKDAQRGAKLDFKSIDAFEKSEALISKYESLTLWLNADILPGPVEATTTPVDPAKFLQLGRKFPCSVLSLGWTTKYGGNITEGEYNSQQIGTMLRIINENHINQTVTFAVRAGLAANSQPVILDLLRETSSLNSTMTVWSSEGDHVEVDRLRALILTVGLDRTYLDLPQELSAKLHLPPPDTKTKN